MLTVNAGVGANLACADPKHAFPHGNFIRLEYGRFVGDAVQESTFDKRRTPASYALHVLHTPQVGRFDNQYAYSSSIIVLSPMPVNSRGQQQRLELYLLPASVLNRRRK
jgi:hypothetical protein